MSLYEHWGIINKQPSHPVLIRERTGKACSGRGGLEDEWSERFTYTVSKSLSTDRQQQTSVELAGGYTETKKIKTPKATQIW